MANSANLWQTTVLYSILAESLPQEGRDYRVDIEASDSGKILSVSLAGLTPLGDAWVPLAMKAIKSYSDRYKETVNDQNQAHEG